MKNLTWKIPVNWTKRAIVDMEAETFEEAVDKVTAIMEDRKNLNVIDENGVSVPWSYEVDIDACDVYQTPEALERMFANE